MRSWGEPGPIPGGGVVLGGLAGVAQRLQRPEAAIRVAALAEALKYGSKGLALAIAALNDPYVEVRRAAYRLFGPPAGKAVQAAIAQCDPYPLFQAGRSVAGTTVQAFSGEGRYVASRTRQGIIKVWEAATGEEWYRLPPAPGPAGPCFLAEGGQLFVRAVTVPRRPGARLEVWDRGEKTWELVGHEGQVGGIALAPDRQTLATGGYFSEIKLWNLHTGKAIVTLDKALVGGSHRGAVMALAFDPLGEYLYSGGYDRTIKQWHVKTRDRPRNPFGRTAAVLRLLVSPDRRWLAAAGWDRVIYLWDIAAGTRQSTLTGHSAPIERIAFNHDGRILASGGSDRQILLWYVATGQLCQTLTGSEGYIEHLTFTEDGQQLLSAGSDRHLRFWHP
ncbi:MAG: WD40 repeat domain-containing protein [Oscillatoriales cyanobacterium SM2_1_8]|nr:WD40 repeat domain-containing protein [Oscillatoriales cyanobacterium SM2_1_8]